MAKDKHLVRVMILLRPETVAQLKVLQKQGTTASGYIRSLIEREFAKKKGVTRT